MDDDRALYRRWLEGRDERAFGELARRHADLVTDVAWRASGDVAAAEDALQEALLALAKDGTTRPAEVGPRAWLARHAILAARHARGSARARARRERAAGEARPEAAMETTDAARAAAVKEALSRLEGEDAVAIALRYVHEVPYDEIAAVLDVAEPTARVRVHRALERLRAEARRGDLDDARLFPLLLGLPRAAAAAARVEAAIVAATTATVGVSAIPAAGTAAAAAGTGLSLFAKSAIGIGLALGLGLGAWAAFSPGGAGASSSPRGPRADAGSSGASLAVRPAGEAAAAAVPAATPGDDGFGGSVVPAPSRASGNHDDFPPLHLVAVRLELQLPDGSVEPLPIDRITIGGEERVVDPTSPPPATTEIRGPSGVRVHTPDARAAFPWLLALVTVPSPPVTILRVPSRDDPRLRTIVLEIVNGKDVPIEGAVAEWHVSLGRTNPTPAGADGRIRLELPPDADPIATVEYLLWIWSSDLCIRARGYRPHGGLREGGRRSAVISPPPMDVALLRRWLERGAWKVVLDELPSTARFAERAVRLVDSAGRPVVGADLTIMYSWTKQALETVRALHGALTPADLLSPGFRTSGPDGVARFPSLLGFEGSDVSVDGVGLELRVDGVPFAAWGLSNAEWPAEGPRELRVPDRAELEVTIQGLPGGQGGWTRDRLGAARTPSDGLPVGRFVEHDATAAKTVEAGGLYPVWMQDVAGGPIEGDPPTLKATVAAGRPARFVLRAGDQERLLTETPNARGTVRLLRRWDELPKMPKLEGEEDAAPPK